MKQLKKKKLNKDKIVDVLEEMILSSRTASVKTAIHTYRQRETHNGKKRVNTKESLTLHNVGYM